MKARRFVAIVSMALSSCYLSREPADDAAVDAGACGVATIECVARPANACNRPMLVAPECDVATRTWRCPSASHVYARVASPSATCVPYVGGASPLASVGGAEARIPTGDGRCLVVFEEVVTTAGVALRNVAVVEDLDLAFGTCPSVPRFLGLDAASSVITEGTLAPTDIVQITGAIRIAGDTRVAYRMFRYDPNSTFGLLDLGTEFAHFDEGFQRVFIGRGVPFPPSIDLADGTLDDDGTEWVFGCPATPASLLEPCVLAQVHPMDAVSYVGVNGALFTDFADSVPVFSAGPWTSSLFRTNGRSYVHAYVQGFGQTIEGDRASSVVGPYAQTPRIASCVLPRGDRSAYCTGPVVHEEWIDPKFPNEIPMVHSVGTTAPDGVTRRANDPVGYSHHLVRATIAP